VADQESAYADKLKDRNRGNDRIVTLKPIEGKQPLNTLGMVDKRLFDGKNQLHCILDPETSLWSFKLEQGLVPGALEQRFTTFGKALAYAKEYYAKRNVSVES